jgi:hypothetical protein
MSSGQNEWHNDTTVDARFAVADSPSLTPSTAPVPHQPHRI